MGKYSPSPLRFADELPDQYLKCLGQIYTGNQSLNVCCDNNWIMEPEVLVEKENLKIRTASPEDAKILCIWWNDGAVMEHAGFPERLGITEEKITASIEKDHDLNRRLILEFNGTPIGEMNCRTTGERVTEIGIKICDAGTYGTHESPVFYPVLL